MTDYAREILIIAQRVVAERASGRHVAPDRLNWAHGVIREHAQATPMECGDERGHPIRIIRPAGTWELANREHLRPAGPFDGLAA